MDTLARGATPLVSGSAGAEPLDLPAGWVLDGCYRVLRRIGVGGVGSVFEVERFDDGARLAVKVIHPAHVALGEALARFRGEAAALAAVSCAQVVSLVGAGDAVTPRGVLPYLAMELVLGPTVGELLDDGPLSPRVACWLAADALVGLEAVHAAGVLHRDLKPENLALSSPPSGERRVKLIDFGLARVLGERCSKRITRLGFTVGTPSYMAPEQALGDPHADHRIDLFSMGVTLYEMLTRHLPFDGPGDTSTLAQVLTAEPVPPSAHRPELPPALDALVLRALEKLPSRRYADAAEFRAALHQFLATSTEQPRDAGPVVATP